MIISASRRTDIPTYYSKWFLNRVRAGYVYVRNPMNAHQISRVSLLPDVVDGIVREAMGSALVKLRAGGRLYSGNGISTDVIGASIRAYISALNKIVYEEA